MLTARSRFAALLLLTAGAFVIGSCASNSAPKGWLDSPEYAGRVAFGAWAELTVEQNGGNVRVRGELIAVHDDSIFVLAYPNSFIAARRDSVVRVKLTTYRPQNSKTSAWGLAGSLSSLSHGVGAIISLPMWILFGSLSSASVSREPQEVYNRSTRSGAYRVTLDNLAIFARFPQGIPPSVDRTLLHPKTMVFQEQ